jgi:hypothetical protein
VLLGALVEAPLVVADAAVVQHDRLGHEQRVPATSLLSWVGVYHSQHHDTVEELA